MKSIRNLFEDEYNFSHVDTATPTYNFDYVNSTDSEYDFSHIDNSTCNFSYTNTIVSKYNFDYIVTVLETDKITINTELKAICDVEKQTALPLDKIREVLCKYSLQTNINETDFDTDIGDKDFDLMKNCKIVDNSKLIIYWKKDEFFVINAYID